MKPFKPLRLPVRSLLRISKQPHLYAAAFSAGARDDFIIKARSTPAQFIELRTELMRQARRFHRMYWQALRRVRTAEVVEFPLRRQAG